MHLQSHSNLSLRAALRVINRRHTVWPKRVAMKMGRRLSGSTRAGTPTPQCGTGIPPVRLPKTAWTLAKLQRPAKAGPAAHFDCNERHAYFGDRTPA